MSFVIYKYENNYNMKTSDFKILIGIMLIAITAIPSLILILFSNIGKVIYIIGNKVEDFLFWYMSKIDRLFNID